jgi:DNA-binding NarL/FixJ family response regulator
MKGDKHVMEKTRIVLSDSYVLFREGLHFTLSGEEDFEVIGETKDNNELHEMLANDPPDIVFMGIGYNRLQEFGILYRITSDLPSVSVILVINDDDVEGIVRAISCGISACIFRNTGESVPLDAVNSIIRGELPIIDTILIPDIASAILSDFGWVTDLDSNLRMYVTELSQYETELLTAISSGMETGELAGRFNTDSETLRNNIKSIRNKLMKNYQNRTLIENIKQSAAPRELQDQEHSLPEYVTRQEFIQFKNSLKTVIVKSFSSLKEL